MAKKNAPESPETPPAEGAAPEQAAEKPAGEKKEKKEKKAKPDAAPKPEPAKQTGGEGPKVKKKPGIAPPRGKKLRNQLKNLRQKIAKESPAPLRKAIQLLKSIKRAKFDETVEVHLSLGVDTTQSDQMIRGSIGMPHGIGKSKRVVVFCQGEDIKKALDAGADAAGEDDLIKRIQADSWLDFDVALASQALMGKVSRLGKVLGPRGLMPTPKAGTVIPAGGDVGAAVGEFKAGKVEYRTDKGGNVHAGVGKMSFDETKLAENITTFVDQIRAVKPSGVKGNYIHSITIAGTMTPGVPVSM